MPSTPSSSEFEGGHIELEQMGSADPPLVVHCFHGDRHRQLRGPGTGGGNASGLGDILAAAAARVAAVHLSVHVRVAVLPHIAQREKNMKTFGTRQVQSTSALISKRIAEPGDWRGK